jgi:hypothetical protein
MSCGKVLWVHRVRYSGSGGNSSGRCEIQRWRGTLHRRHTNFASDDDRRIYELTPVCEELTIMGNGIYRRRCSYRRNICLQRQFSLGRVEVWERS